MTTLTRSRAVRLMLACLMLATVLVPASLAATSSAADAQVPEICWQPDCLGEEPPNLCEIAGWGCPELNLPPLCADNFQAIGQRCVAYNTTGSLFWQCPGAPYPTTMHFATSSKLDFGRFRIPTSCSYIPGDTPPLFRLQRQLVWF